MNESNKQLTITLSPLQLSALETLAVAESTNLEALVSRSIDAFTTAYQISHHEAQQKVESRQDVIIKLLVALTRMVAQVLYFVTMPITLGPTKSKLTNEGVALQWRQSEKFAEKLLTPPNKAGSVK